MQHNIGCFEVAMHKSFIAEGCKSIHHLFHNSLRILLTQLALGFYESLEVGAIAILHENIDG